MDIMGLHYLSCSPTRVIFIIMNHVSDSHNYWTLQTFLWRSAILCWFSQCIHLNRIVVFNLLSTWVYKIYFTQLTNKFENVNVKTETGHCILKVNLICINNNIIMMIIVTVSLKFIWENITYAAFEFIVLRNDIIQ